MPPPPVLLLDGGMGRQLQAMGAPFRQPEWSALALIEAPHTVQAAHAAFLHAGARVVTTNSYALVPFHLGQERFAAGAHVSCLCAAPRFALRRCARCLGLPRQLLRVVRPSLVRACTCRWA
jgi:S-methylmethionine-dependent homocysteine/selenocysteine methylase